MSDKINKLLEKYDPTSILAQVMEHYNPTSIHGGSFVVIDPEAFKNEEIMECLKKKGEPWVAQLQKLANDKQIMYVTALKTVRPTSAYIAELPANNFEEADLVIHKVPGLYSSPITVPTAILKQITDPMFIHQQPMSDEFNQKVTIDKGSPLDNEYNKGEQPKGTRTKGGNN